MVARRVVLLVACAAALVPKRSPGQIVAAASTREVERVAPLIIPRGAAVLEIGSQLGRTTAALAAAAGGRIVGVDVARKAPRRASERSALFRNASGSDCCDFREVRGASWADIDGALASDERFDCVVVDAQALLGADAPLDTLALCNALRSRQDAPPPRVVVKSATLAGLAGRLFSAAGDDLSRLDRVLAVSGERRRHLDADRVYEPRPVLVAAVGVDEYRSVIDAVVRPGDSALECGCHFGTTTALLKAAVGDGGACLGVDVGPSIVAAAAAKHGAFFKIGDAWAARGLADLAPHGGRWDVVFVDVGGLSSAYATLEALALARSLGAALDPRVVVFKSKCLRALADDLLPSSRVITS